MQLLFSHVVNRFSHDVAHIAVLLELKECEELPLFYIASRVAYCILFHLPILKYKIEDFDIYVRKHNGFCEMGIIKSPFCLPQIISG